MMVTCSELCWEDGGEEILVSLPLPDGIRSQDVSCHIKQRFLDVTVAGGPGCAGNLYHDVDPANSCWFVESTPVPVLVEGQEAKPEKKVLMISLTKRVAGHKWDDLWSPGCQDAVQFAGSRVIGSKEDDGDHQGQESVEDQLEGERVLEPQYLKLLSERGVDDEETLRVFFKLFDEKIQLYRLNDLDAYLQEVVPACRKRNDDFRIKGIQSLSLLRFKQCRHQECLDLQLELEQLPGCKNAIMSENIAHTYCALGNLQEAEKRYRESLLLGQGHNGGSARQGRDGPPRGSTLMGLGIAYERMGRMEEAFATLEQAYNFYKDIACGRPSSLQAKAGVALARVTYAASKNANRAELLLREAIMAYEVTCGADSPLLGTALEQLVHVLMLEGRTLEARPSLEQAYRLRVAQDSWNLDEIVPLHCMLMSSHTAPPADTVDRRDFQKYFPIVDKGVAKLRTTSMDSMQKLIYCKLAAEVRAWGGDYATAKQLLQEVLTITQEVGDSVAVRTKSHAEELLSICEQCLSGALIVPWKVKLDQDEYRLLRPPIARKGPCKGKPQSTPGSCLPPVPMEATENNEQGLSLPARGDQETEVAPLECRALAGADFSAVQALWKATGAEQVLPSAESFERHLLANPALSFLASRNGDAVGVVISGKAKPHGIVRQLVTASEVVDVLGEVKELLLERSFAALRLAGCTSVMALAAHKDVQEKGVHQFWSRTSLAQTGVAERVPVLAC
eukprot:TRINITY_DN10621_c0_g2_i2.p1 TRINITY_DN10621_c0_g2~~TRINITY_DN10621_c0_g2_i2.p1  ORF type:complete len:733 (-),score=170.33 TRINITY_DN10621_c0_g2_i2:170-2368(-)